MRRALSILLFTLLTLFVASGQEYVGAAGQKPVMTPTCQDGVWEDGEFCGYDAYKTSGIPDMNHDCKTDALDMILFIPTFYSNSLSGDFNGDQFTDYDDLVFLKHRLGIFTTPCNGTPVPDVVEGTIALSFSTNPATIDDNENQALGGSHTLWVVVDNISGAKAIEYAVRTSTNVILIDHFATTTSDYNNSCATDSLKSMVISLPAPLASGPQIIAGIQYFINDLNPGTVEIVSSACAGRIRWFGTDLALSHHFGTITNAGINGATPGPTPPTDNTPAFTVGLVSGTVYADVVGDCTFNGADFVVANRWVEANPGNYTAQTSDEGEYRFWLPPGNYDVKLLDGANDPWQLRACQAPVTGVVVTAGNATAGPNIALNLTGAITGTVFRDVDANCAQNGSDYGIASRMIEVNPGGYIAFTDVDGNYSVTVPVGSYTVTQAVVTGDLWALQPCNATSYPVTVTAGGTITNKNFALYWTGPPLCKVSVAVCSNGTVANGGCPGNHPWRTPCPGFESEYLFILRSDPKVVDDVPAGAQMVLTLDPAYVISTVTSADAFTTVGSTANTRTIQFTDAIKPGETRVVAVRGTPNPNSGSKFLTQVAFDSGFCLGKKYASIQDLAQCSCDPNDMAVDPAGCGAGGEVIGDQPFVYKVRFENVGPGAAHNIVVNDVLDADLDLSSLTLVSSSHTVTGMQIEAGNKLVIRFDDIELAGSFFPTQNKGYAIFMISPKPNLPNGTWIHNTADIYFDYNEPVITNTVLNTIKDTPCPVTGVDPRAGVPVATFLGQNHPNPFNPTTTLEYGLAAPERVTISVYNINGELVRTLVNDRKSAGWYSVEWDGRNQSGSPVASGVYLSKMTAGSFVETKKLVLLK